MSSVLVHLVGLEPTLSSMSRKVLTSHTTDALFGAGRPRREVECGELTRLPESNLILAFTYRHCLVVMTGIEPV